MPDLPDQSSDLADAFEVALKLSGLERTEWIDTLPTSLQSDLRQLLTQHENLGEFLGDIAVKLADSTKTQLASETDLPPTVTPHMQHFGDVPLAIIEGYEIQEEISRGGMGVVWKARQVSLNRTVAIKQIQTGSLASTAERVRFQIEAEAVAALNHPGIVQIYEVSTADGSPFFSMEFIDGQTLSSYVRNEAPSPFEVAGLVSQVAEAVCYAHEQGVLHRDLKPANVLLTADLRTKLTDFGLARMSESVDGPTLSGQLLGTPAYMAPEQARADADAVGEATDVYGLGAMLYFALTKQAPFGGQTVADTIRMVVEEEVRPPRSLVSTIPKDLEAVCLKALQKSPQLRYPSADQFAADLNRFLNGVPTIARPRSAAQKMLTASRRLLTWKTTSALLLLIVAAIIWMRPNSVLRDSKSVDLKPPPSFDEVYSVSQQYPWGEDTTDAVTVGMLDQPTKLPDAKAWQLVPKGPALVGHSSEPWSNFFAGLTSDGCCYVYDLQTCELADVVQVTQANGELSVFSLSPDGNRILVGSTDGETWIADRRSNSRVALESDAGDVSLLASWISNQKIVVTFSDHARAFESDGRELWKIKLPARGIATPYVCPNREFVAFQYERSGYEIYQFDGKKVAAADNAQFLCWNYDGNGFVRQLPDVDSVESVQIDHPDRGTRLCSVPAGGGPLYAKPSIDGKQVIVGSNDTEVWLVNVESDKHSVIMSDATYLKSLGFRGRRGYNVSRPWHVSYEGLVHNGNAPPTRFYHDGYCTVISLHEHSDGRILCGATNATSPVISLAEGDLSIRAATPDAYAKDGAIKHAFWFGDDKMISIDSVPRLSNLDGQLLQKLPLDFGVVCLDPKGEILAVSRRDGVMQLLTKDGKVVAIVDEALTGLSHPSFSQDGEKFCVFEKGNRIRIFLRDGSLEEDFVIDHCPISAMYPGSVAWSACKRYVAYNNRDEFVVVDLKQKKALPPVTGYHRSDVLPAWHPSEPLVAAASYSSIRIHRVEDGQIQVKTVCSRFANFDEKQVRRGMYGSLLWTRVSGYLAAGCWGSGRIDLFEPTSGSLVMSAQLGRDNVLVSPEGRIIYGELDDMDDSFVSVVTKNDESRSLENYSDTMKRLFPAEIVDHWGAYRVPTTAALDGVGEADEVSEDGTAGESVEEAFNRYVAEQLLSGGHSLGILEPEFVTPQSVAELPATPFFVIYVGTSGPISDELLKQIALLKHLAAFHFFFNQAGDDDIRQFSNMGSLDSFCVAGRDITNQSLIHMARSPLTCLRIAHTRVDEAGIKIACQTWPDLEEFAFGAPSKNGTLIGDSVMPDVHKLKQLKRLSMFKTGLTDDSVPLLTTMKHLEKLDVRSTQITEQGLEILKHSLQECEIVSGEFQSAAIPVNPNAKERSETARRMSETREERLSREVAEEILSSRGYCSAKTPEFVVIREESDIPNIPFTILHVNTGKQNLSRDLVDKIARSSVTSISIYPSNSSDDLLAPFDGNRSLFQFGTSGKKVTLKTLKYFENAPLKHLGFHSCCAGDRELKFICETWPQLEHLLIGLGHQDQPCGPITDDGVRELTKLKKLNFLRLEKTQITDASIPILSGLKQLKTLDVRGTGITDEGAEKLRSALPNCDIRTGEFSF